MTGRRQIKARDHDGRIAPLSHAQKAARVLASIRSRYAGAATSRDRLDVAFDFFRSAAAKAEKAGLDEAGLSVEEATRLLLSRGDQICAALTKRGRP